MAFVDDNQVEEILRVFFVQSRAIFVLRQSLIDGEIDLAALDRVAIFNLRARVAELREDFIFRIIDENVAVGEIKNFRAAMFTASIPTRVPEFPTNLKR